MLQIAIVEDERSNQEQLCEYITRYGAETGEEFSIRCFMSGEAFLREYDGRYDLVLLDVEMPGKDGMETARFLRKIDEQTVLVFITNMAQYAIQGYMVQALDYILKPISYISFKMRFARALGRVDYQKDAQILLDCNGQIVRIAVRSILYVEIQQKRLCYHTEQGDYTLRGTLKSVEDMLAKYPFAKGNYWYLVNLARVSTIGAKTLFIGDGDTELPVSRGCRAELLAAFNDYIGNTRR